MAARGELRQPEAVILAKDIAGSAVAETEANMFSQDHCLIICEVAQAHDGSLGTAHAFIDAAADAGADAIKFQTHIAAAESTPGEPWRVKFSPQDATRFEYWRRMEFRPAHWHGLREHARERGLLFLSSPFSLEAVALLTQVGVDAWKIASGEVCNNRLFAEIAATGRPVLLSTGMSSFREIDDAVSRLRERELAFVLLQCTSCYPCPPEKVGLNMIASLRARYECNVGLSDHSGTVFPGLAAATLGISALEVHITFSRQMFGPDVSSSLTPDEVRTLVEGIRFIERMRSHPVDKDAMAAELAPMRRLFTKSLVARQALPEGTVLREDHLTLKKPGTGMPASRLSAVVNRRLRHSLAADALLTEDDLE